MISELVKELRELQDNTEIDCYGIRELNEVCMKAADTIEELSAKVARQNMERSSQYYGGGWIPVDERLPETSDSMLVAVQYDDGNIIIDIGFFNSKSTNRLGKWNIDCIICHVIAWQPLPQAYEPKEEKLTKYDSPFCNEIEK